MTDPVLFQNGQLMEAIPIFDGKSEDLQYFLTAAQQYVAIRENKPLTVSHVMARLRGKAARVVHMANHNHDWIKISEILTTEFGEKESLDLLQIKLSNIHLRTTYSDLINDLKETLFQIKHKLVEKVDLSCSIRIFEIMARSVLINQLPFQIRAQFIISDGDFANVCEKVKILEAHGQLDNRRNVMRQSEQALDNITRNNRNCQTGPPIRNEIRNTNRFNKNNNFANNMNRNHNNNSFNRNHGNNNRSFHTNPRNHNYRDFSNNTFRSSHNSAGYNQSTHNTRNHDHQNRNEDVSMRTAPRPIMYHQEIEDFPINASENKI